VREQMGTSLVSGQKVAYCHCDVYSEEKPMP
jgi:hypothetical protein